MIEIKIERELTDKEKEAVKEIIDECNYEEDMEIGFF